MASGELRELGSPVSETIEIPEYSDNFDGLNLYQVVDDAQRHLWAELMTRKHPLSCVFHAAVDGFEKSSEPLKIQFLLWRLSERFTHEEPPCKTSQ